MNAAAHHLPAPARESGALCQRTLKHSIHCSGVTLHRGVHVQMTMHSAAPDTGIVFRRTDIAGGNAVIAASWRNVVQTPLCTTLANADGVTIATVEHLLAALSGCGIDNMVVEVNGPELPIMDGSAWPFVFLAECAGVVDQDAPRRGIVVRKPIRVSDGAAWASLMPGDGFSCRMDIDYEGPSLARQSYSVALDEASFRAEVSRARTFGFLHEVESLRAAGLARGASLENAVVVTSEGVLNEGGLRFPDELARHKLLDAVGDLYLAGTPLIGRFHGHRSGHRLNHELLRALFADRRAWSTVVMEDGIASAAYERALATA